MSARDFAALDEYSLIARVLHEVDEVDSRTKLLNDDLSSPLLPMDPPGRAPESLALVAAVRIAEHPEEFQANSTIPLLANDKMGELVERVKGLAGAGHPALALDVRTLSATPPFGNGRWRPRTREELAELRAAADCPFWVVGVHSTADAEVAAEAGLEGVVIGSALAEHLGGPAAIAILPEILDAVAGMIGVYVGGQVRTGIDLFRYLAVGAEAIVVETDRSLASLEGELHYAMRLTGCATLADIGWECIHAPLFQE